MPLPLAMMEVDASGDRILQSRHRGQVWEKHKSLVFCLLPLLLSPLLSNLWLSNSSTPVLLKQMPSYGLLMAHTKTCTEIENKVSDTLNSNLAE